MKNILYSSALFLLAFTVWGCSDFLDPEWDNTIDEQNVFETAGYFCGPLNDVYSDLPPRFNTEMDVMTDNAVRGDFTGDYYRASTGALSPALNPLDVWSRGYMNIRKLNIFLSKMVLDPDPEAPFPTPVRFVPIGTPAGKQQNIDIFYRLMGEAYFLRAYWQAELLRNYGGRAADQSVLGVPFVGDLVLDVNDKNDIPRATYAKCVEEIVADCDRAIELLPDLYRGGDAAIGRTMIGRASGAAAKALKARVLLYAASPAFNLPYDASKWEDAAMAAWEAIKALGLNLSVANVFASRDNYYFDQLTNVNTPIPDVIFRGPTVSNNSELETENYPRGMYGQALINVSQNFVDAFPDNMGYPLSESATVLPGAPYENRDPRLALFVGLNDSRMGASNYYTVASHTGGRDAYDPLKKTSRTGYYLKKTLKALSLRPGNTTSTMRANVLIGMPEVFLTFAEAANQAWGVSGDPNAYGFTAKSILSIVLKRHNTANGATYLNNVIGEDRAKFDNYVRNERRIELSFEGHYYYDLRRWIGDGSAASLNVAVNGVEITRSSGGTYTYLTRELEKRDFKSPYQPIPYSEIYNSPSPLLQNSGW